MPEGDLTYNEAMHLNRHERRKLKKLNNLEFPIPGASLPIINKVRQLKKEEKKTQDALSSRYNK